MSSLWQTVSENVVFVLEFLALIVVMFLIAYVIEKAVKKKNSDTERVLATRKIVVIGVFSAIAASLRFPSYTPRPNTPKGRYVLQALGKRTPFRRNICGYRPFRPFRLRRSTAASTGDRRPQSA